MTKQVLLTYYTIQENIRHWALVIGDEVLMSGYYSPFEEHTIRESIVTFFRKLETRLFETFVINSREVTLSALGLVDDPEEDMDLDMWISCMATYADKVGAAQAIINNIPAGSQTFVRAAAKEILNL